MFRFLGKTAHSCQYSLCSFSEGLSVTSVTFVNNFFVTDLVICGRWHYVTSYICSYQAFLALCGQVQISAFRSGNLKSNVQLLDSLNNSLSLYPIKMARDLKSFKVTMVGGAQNSFPHLKAMVIPEGKDLDILERGTW